MENTKSDVILPFHTTNDLSLIMLHIICIESTGNFLLSKIYKRPSFQTESNAFSRSMRQAPITIPRYLVAPRYPTICRGDVSAGLVCRIYLRALVGCLLGDDPLIRRISQERLLDLRELHRSLIRDFLQNLRCELQVRAATSIAFKAACVRHLEIRTLSAKLMRVTRAPWVGRKLVNPYFNQPGSK
ncbi:unnamed protein product [Trichogramma brassicae]|uniref:Uncharacterized protein n=1 Tax=Trichogramma brassicae TaxID=86971 RepID=A0A6H5J1G3_9HYME|nr:unnamed protein product [Trichogramma brassicae]